MRLDRSDVPARLDVRDLSVAHVQDAVGNRGRFRVVRNHQHGLLQLAAGSSQHSEHGVGVLGIEIAGGLIGKNDGWPCDQGSGNGDALLLAARELVWPMIEAAVDAEELGEVVEERAVERSFAAGDFVRDLDVAHGRKRGKEVKALKNKAYLGFAEIGARAVGQWRKIDAVDLD